MKSSGIHISGDLGCLYARSGFQFWLLILISDPVQVLGLGACIAAGPESNSTKTIQKNYCKCDKEALGASVRVSADCKLILLPCLSGKLAEKIIKIW